MLVARLVENRKRVVVSTWVRARLLDGVVVLFRAAGLVKRRLLFVVIWRLQTATQLIKPHSAPKPLQFRRVALLPVAHFAGPSARFLR